MFSLKKLIPSLTTKRKPGDIKAPSIIKLSRELQKNKEALKKILGEPPDLEIRKLRLGKNKETTALLFWLDSIVDLEKLQLNIIKPLHDCNINLNECAQPLDLLKNEVLTISQISIFADLDSLAQNLLEGEVILLLEGKDEGLVLKTADFKKRALDKPETEIALKGPRTSFIEDLNTNISLIRHILKNKHLRMEALKLGKETRTEVNIIYLENIVNEPALKEVRNRLKKIEIDSILGSTYIIEMIEDSPLSLFPTVGSTERPDSLAAHLLEGGIGIIVDGSPFALKIPLTFFMFFQTSDDYYTRYPIATFTRFVRLFGLLSSLLLPSIYVGVISFHPELLPPSLLIKIVASRSGIPFPPVVEAFIMELIFESLREASLRMPRAIGSAISIVGALILGEAAIQAGIVSPPMVVIVAGTAIASFIVSHPEITATFRILRFLMLILASILGFIGILFGLIGLHIHMCSLRSFGIPYMSPLGPANIHDLADIFVRLPQWAMPNRSPVITHGKTGSKKSWPTRRLFIRNTDEKGKK